MGGALLAVSLSGSRGEVVARWHVLMRHLEGIPIRKEGLSEESLYTFMRMRIGSMEI